MVIKNAISPYPSLHENMVVKAYEAQSPDAEVASFTIVERNADGEPEVGAGHQVPVTYTLSGLDRVVHIVRLFTASATLLHEYDREPTVDLVTLFDPIRFRIGDGDPLTPAAGTNVYTNDVFGGLEAENISVSQEGFGYLHPTDDYILTGNELTLTDTEFEPDQRWYILQKPEVVVEPVNDSVVGKGFGGFVDIVADTDYIPGHLRKLIRLSGTGNYTFPTATPVPIGYNHSFTNFGANPSTPIVYFDNGGLKWAGTLLAGITLPFKSTLTVTWDGTDWNVVEYGIYEDAIPAIGDILYVGNYNVGDIATVQDGIVTVTHGQDISGNYEAICQIRSASSDYTRDNAISHCTREFTANSFKVGLRDLVFGRLNNFSIRYILVRS